MSSIQNIVVLTGAGISAESGIATFRGPGGLWEGHRVEDVCTPQALARDPELVHRFYDLRRAALAGVEPNAAHHALARLDAEWPGELLIVTQNVDDLHERAGAKRMLHMHGELKSALCAACEHRQVWAGDMPPETICAACGAPTVRPDIVFFGEMPYAMDVIERAISAPTVRVDPGRQGAVYPAAGFVRPQISRSADAGAQPRSVGGSAWFQDSRLGPAGVGARWVGRCLASPRHCRG